MPDVWVLSEWIQLADGAHQPAVVRDYPAPLGWSDVTGQLDRDVLDGLEQSVVMGRLDTAQAAALQSGARYTVLSVGDPAQSDDLTGEQLAALVTSLTAALSSDVARYATDATASPDVIVGRLVEANTRPVWRMELSVAVDEVYYYAGNLYQVIQAHTTQADWTPDRVPALFRRFHEPDDDPWPWVQPTGAHDAYPLGARVLHDAHTYVSLIAANAWEPGAVGSEALWECLDCSPIEEVWAADVAYVGDNTAGAGQGDVVVYAPNQRRYRCLQSHTSLAGWTPDVTPALWLDLDAV